MASQYAPHARPAAKIGDADQLPSIPPPFTIEVLTQDLQLHRVDGGGRARSVIRKGGRRRVGTGVLVAGAVTRARAQEVQEAVDGVVLDGEGLGADDARLLRRLGDRVAGLLAAQWLKADRRPKDAWDPGAQPIQLGEEVLAQREHHFHVGPRLLVEEGDQALALGVGMRHVLDPVGARLEHLIGNPPPDDVGQLADELLPFGRGDADAGEELLELVENQDRRQLACRPS